jgi:hypothetical protein
VRTDPALISLFVPLFVAGDLPNHHIVTMPQNLNICRFHGVPAQKTGDVTTIMLSFNTAKQHDVLVQEAIMNFRMDHRELVKKHPELWEGDDCQWDSDPAPKYAQQLAGHGRGGFTAGQARLGRTNLMSRTCSRDLQAFDKVEAGKMLSDLLEWIVETEQT